jgi:glycopeptide antibiotics resistance protein
MLDGRWLYVAAVPIAFWILARRTTPGRRLVALVALAHVAILANVALFPIPIDPIIVAAGRAAAGSFGADGPNPFPFATIGPVLAGHAPAIATRIAFLNLFVLTPAGIYLPALWSGLRNWRGLIVLTILGGTSIEAAQLAISAVLGFAYRAIDIDDVILNTIGIVVGWLAFRAALLRREPATRSGPDVATDR